MSMAARAWTPNALVDLPSPKQPRLSSVATSAQQLQARQLPAGETCGDPQSSGRVVTVGGPSTGGKGNNGAGARASKRQRTDRTTLTYWNGRGLCESIRFMLAFTGEEYTECVPGFDGATHLAEPVHMQHLRDEGMLMWNQVPLLCIDGLQLVQSKAAVRYLAEKHDVRGATPAEVAMTDMVAEGIADWKALIGNPFEFRFGAHAQTPAQRHQTSTGNAKYLPLLERRLAKSGTGYLVGESQPLLSLSMQMACSRTNFVAAQPDDSPDKVCGFFLSQAPHPRMLTSSAWRFSTKS
eukprot:COSAG05_NODE_127_length_17241_cov_7.514817_4_plen_295_part_00